MDRWETRFAGVLAAGKRSPGFEELVLHSVAFGVRIALMNIHTSFTTETYSPDNDSSRYVLNI